MLETAEERVKMLKKGFSQKQIETMYIKENDFKIVSPPVLVDMCEINEKQDKKISMNCEAAVEYAQLLCSEMANLCDITKLTETIYKNKYLNITALEL